MIPRIQNNLHVDCFIERSHENTYLALDMNMF